MSEPGLLEFVPAAKSGPFYEQTELRNPHFTVMVWRYLFGQCRIMLTDKRRPDPRAENGHGTIVQQLCTYSFPRCAEICMQLAEAEDPLALARSWARPWNCEAVGGRIRMDNEPNPIAEP